jgi:hypothetical protein
LVFTEKPDKAFRTRLAELVESGICLQIDGYENCYCARGYLVCVAEESGHERLIKKKLQERLVASTRRFWHQREYHLSLGGNIVHAPVSRPELVVLCSSSSAEDVPLPSTKKMKKKVTPKPNAGVMPKFKKPEKPAVVEAAANATAKWPGEEDSWPRLGWPEGEFAGRHPGREEGEG